VPAIARAGPEENALANPDADAAGFRCIASRLRRIAVADFIRNPSIRLGPSQRIEHPGRRRCFSRNVAPWAGVNCANAWTVFRAGGVLQRSNLSTN